MLDPILLQQNGGALSAVVLIVYLVVLVATIAGLAKIFSKAGEPAWAAIVPIYNMYLLITIGGNPWWYLLLLFVPLVNVLVLAKVSIDVAKAFGKGVGYGLGLWLVQPVFYPLLGFGDATYQGRP
ncbi:DUF5684 domain-containing protein [Halobaculum sp. CBA1158]|uniref:DUF5684 domain-containing protein n=1 Tax=Halobaculum sp. CBA1158 TaxID=2904243 RepID=UPI001F1DAF18|nr:DUF5684 domain-containing protein [Halobaculum sp. CBA1158]UIP00464.1 DUF5684 domain-containing protein [Halobaculum sp. CBA1158]